MKDPRNVALYVDFANIAMTHQSFQTGIDMIDSGLNLEPKASELYLARGVLYVQLAAFDEAEADFEKAGAGSTALAQRHRGWSLRKRTRAILKKRWRPYAQS